MTAREKGVLQIYLPEVETGETFDVTIVSAPKERIVRKAGLYEGMITIAPDFDDPIPDLEE